MPLQITSVGVVICFRADYFNIGAQGQFYMGAIAAAFAAEALRGSPTILAIPTCLIAGVAGGALWALWLALLRVRAGANAVITTMTGNFIAALVLVHVTSGPLKDPSGSGQAASSLPIDATHRISGTTGTSPIIVAIADAVAGAELAAGSLQNFSINMTAGRGFMGFAAMIFDAGHAIGATFAAFFFAFAGAVWIRAQLMFGERAPSSLLLCLPCIATIIGLWLSARLRGKSAAGASELGRL